MIDKALIGCVELEYSSAKIFSLEEFLLLFSLLTKALVPRTRSKIRRVHIPRGGCPEIYFAKRVLLDLSFQKKGEDTGDITSNHNLKEEDLQFIKVI